MTITVPQLLETKEPQLLGTKEAWELIRTVHTEAVDKVPGGAVGGVVISMILASNGVGEDEDYNDDEKDLVRKATFSYAVNFVRMHTEEGWELPTYGEVSETVNVFEDGYMAGLRRTTDATG